MAENQNNKSAQQPEEVLEETQNEKEEQEEFAGSTVFAAPAEHKDKNKTGRFSLLRKVIAIVLCVAILAGSAFLVVKLIPKKQDEETLSFQPKQVIAVDTSLFNKVTVVHPEATLVLNSTITEEDGQSKQVWSLEGYDNSLLDATTLSQIASYAATVTAYGEYDYDSKTQSEQYGFNNPPVKVEVESDGEYDYTLTAGNTTADGQYNYLHISVTPEKVYLVKASAVSGFKVEPLDLAINTAIPAIEKTSDNSGYFDSEGLLSDFDTITVSGKNFKTPLVFVPNKDELFNTYATYICTSPKTRIADGVVEDMRNIFRDGVAASSAVSFDCSAASLKKFGLDNPDMVITIKVAGKSYYYKMTATSPARTEFYVTSSTDKMIRTVTITNIPFATNEEEDFYMGFMALESIADISEFTLSGEVNASFTIKKDEESEDGEYIVMTDGKKVASKTFQDFYALFLQTTAIDYNTVSVSKKPDLTITMKHHDGSAPTVLTFQKISESRYQYSVGNVPMGQISSTGYSKLVRESAAMIP